MGFQENPNLHSPHPPTNSPYWCHYVCPVLSAGDVAEGVTGPVLVCWETIRIPTFPKFTQSPEHHIIMPTLDGETEVERLVSRL